MAEALAQALMADATFHGNFQSLEIEGLDAAWTTGGLELVVIKGDLAAGITYQSGLDPVTICKALAKKWAQ